MSHVSTIFTLGGGGLRCTLQDTDSHGTSLLFSCQPVALDLLCFTFSACQVLPILLFFSVLKDLWYSLWLHFVNELVLQ